MNTTSKRIASGAVSVALVGGILAGALAVGSNMAAAEPTPTPTSTFDPASFSEFRETVDDAISDLEAEKAAEAEAARVEAERVAAEAAAAEAARVEAERVAAEQAASEQAARDETFEEAPSEQAEPFAPTLCPEGTVPMDVDAAGNQSNCQTSYNQDVVVP